MQSTASALNLVDQLSECALTEFPDGYDYPSRFKNLQNHLNAFYHPSVTPAATISDKEILLTDHGPDHIRTVIKRASDIIRFSGAALLGYEKYILLAAIHVHDVGNFFGRESHELKAEKVMNELGPVLGTETVEKNAIWEIAQAHGGKIGSDKDKIRRLPLTRYVLGQQVRSQFLAALLRFSDELADDRTRVPHLLNKLNKIPAASAVFHKYAYALHTVNITADTIKLSFEVSVSDLQCKFGKGKDKVFLLDEIYDRTMKMHRERIYCMRFLRPSINLDKIDVEIRVFRPGFAKERRPISYRLQESGYPDETKPTIFTLCPALRSGAAYKKLLVRKGGTKKKSAKKKHQ